MTFRLLSKRAVEGTDPFGKPTRNIELEYETQFLEQGKYVLRRCPDIFFPHKNRFLNTAPNVSYYDKLRKAV